MEEGGAWSYHKPALSSLSILRLDYRGHKRLNPPSPVIGRRCGRHRPKEESMTYQIDRSQFIENGPSLRAAAAIARIHTAAIYAVLNDRQSEPRCKAA